MSGHCKLKMQDGNYRKAEDHRVGFREIMPEIVGCNPQLKRFLQVLP